MSVLTQSGIAFEGGGRAAGHYIKSGDLCGKVVYKQVDDNGEECPDDMGNIFECEHYKRS